MSIIRNSRQGIARFETLLVNNNSDRLIESVRVYNESGVVGFPESGMGAWEFSTIEDISMRAVNEVDCTRPKGFLIPFGTDWVSNRKTYNLYVNVTNLRYDGPEFLMDGISIGGVRTEFSAGTCRFVNLTPSKMMTDAWADFFDAVGYEHARVAYRLHSTSSMDEIRDAIRRAGRDMRALMELSVVASEVSRLGIDELVEEIWPS